MYCPEFRIPHSAFRIPHSAFRIPHSAFRIPHSHFRLSAAMSRPDNRQNDQLRPLSFTPDFAPNATGSVLVATGDTKVICSVMVEEAVPRWMREQQVSGGWITAEYSMLPYSTLERKARDISKGKLDGRSVEIQRLIGRSIRAAVDLEALGARTLWIDCDVLQADGGTRTAAISGAALAVGLALRKLQWDGRLKGFPLRQLVAAVSVGVCEGEPRLDLNYLEDRDAAVDANIVKTETGEFVEIQASGEEATFGGKTFEALLALADKGIREILAAQREILNARP
jgi:ribonuclease PH